MRLDLLRQTAQCQHGTQSLGRVLSLWMQQVTDLEVVLARPVRVRLSQEAETVDVLRFHVGETSDFMSSVRHHI